MAVSASKKDDPKSSVKVWLLQLSAEVDARTNQIHEGSCTMVGSRGCHWEICLVPWTDFLCWELVPGWCGWTVRVVVKTVEDGRRSAPVGWFFADPWRFSYFTNEWAYGITNPNPDAGLVTWNLGDASSWRWWYGVKDMYKGLFSGRGQFECVLFFVCVCVSLPKSLTGRWWLLGFLGWGCCSKRVLEYKGVWNPPILATWPFVRKGIKLHGWDGGSFPLYLFVLVVLSRKKAPKFNSSKKTQKAHHPKKDNTKSLPDTICQGLC